MRLTGVILNAEHAVIQANGDRPEANFAKLSIYDRDSKMVFDVWCAYPRHKSEWPDDATVLALEGSQFDYRVKVATRGDKPGVKVGLAEGERFNFDEAALRAIA